MSDNLLSDLVHEEFTEMRWRRDMEDRLVNWYIALSGGITATALAFTQWGDSEGLLFVFSLFSAGLMLGINKRIADKITAEHMSYSAAGQTIVAILENGHHFGTGSKPDIGKHMKDFGTGKGYLKTIKILDFTAGWTSLLLVVTSGVNLLFKLS